MAHVIVKGGTYGVGGTFFGPGATECNDEEVLDAVRNADLPWIYVTDKPPAAVPVKKRMEDFLEFPEEPKPAYPTQGQKLVAETDPTEDHRGAVAKMRDVLAEPAPEPAPGYPCDFCDKVLRNPGGWIAHTKNVHPDNFEAWDAARRAAKE